MTAYYNEIDPYAAAWLRNLIAAGHIAPGDVDERSIEDVSPDDLRPYTQCHFFAGIGVWSHALRQAGWSDDRPIWTGSCPCQPFSAAGKGGGFADERHLWPAFHWLIAQRRPSVVFGEQVASKDGLAWLDLVQADLEGSAYASGAVDLCAAGVGAPHIRQRLWWAAERLADPVGGRGRGGELGREDATDARLAGEADELEHAPSDGRIERRSEPSGRGAAGGCGTGGLGHAADEPRERDAGSVPGAEAPEHGARLGVNGRLPVGPEYAGPGVGGGQPGPTNGIWRDADWLFCRDGKWRPVEPGAFPLAHGASSRVGRLRAYGNAIVAQAAEEFIRAYLESADA